MRDRDWGWLLAALLPLIGILPAFGIGVIDSADGPLHVQRIHAMSVMLGSGELWPRWVPWFHLGFGYPVFNYYPPGVFYLGGVLALLGFIPTISFNIVAAFAWIFGTVGTYALARTFLPARAAILAAALWAYAPSRLYEVWDQGSLPQMLSAAFVPWLLVTIITAANRPTRRHTVYVALSLAGLILTHQPITFITALYVAPATVILIVWAMRKNWRSIWPRAISVYGGLLLGVGLASIFLMPMVLELPLVDAVEGTDDNVAYLVSNFLRPGEVFAQPTPLDLTDLRTELPTMLGLVGGVLFIGGIAALLWRRHFAVAGLLVLAMGFTLYMLLDVSLPLWLNIPFFRQLRFPERFLRVGAVIIALGGGASLLWIPERYRNLALGGLIGLTVAAALPLAYPSQPFVTFPNMTARTEIEFEMNNNTWGTTSYNEFNPIWGDEIPLRRPANIEDYETNPLRLTHYVPDFIRGEGIRAYPVNDNTIRIESETARPIRFHQYYFPGWTATLNGEPTEAYPEPEIGLIAVDVPVGESIVTLDYRGTLTQRIATVLSLASVVIALGVWRSGKPQPAHTSPEHLQVATAMWIGGGIIVFTLLNRLWIAPHTTWFRYASPPDNPATMQIEQRANFGDTFELMGYTLPDADIAPGEVITVTLYWRATRELTSDDNYRPIVQIVNLPVTESWAVSQPFFPGGGQTFRGGYTLDRFASDAHDLQLFDTAKPYTARVMVQMVRARDGEPLRLPDGSDRVLLDTLVRVEGIHAHANEMLDVQFGEAIDLQCASISETGDTLDVTLYWHVRETPNVDYTAFVHGVNDAGEVIVQADRPPLANEYPTSHWVRGQTLTSTFTLAAENGIEAVRVGLYTDAGRAPASENGNPLPDNAVTLPIEPNTCER